MIGRSDYKNICHVDYPEDFCNQKTLSSERVDCYGNQIYFEFYVFDYDGNYYNLTQGRECCLKEYCGLTYTAKYPCENNCVHVKFSRIIKSTNDILFAKSCPYCEALGLKYEVMQIKKQYIYIGEKISVEKYLAAK
ncbi:MAG: hypothetical protein LE169_04335 [Endomicrobium sp.]|nr:hypothetical protein [Endomicrobium sp.]